VLDTHKALALRVTAETYRRALTHPECRLSCGEGARRAGGTLTRAAADSCFGAKAQA
jgi:hypothetical protein